MEYINVYDDYNKENDNETFLEKKTDIESENIFPDLINGYGSQFQVLQNDDKPPQYFKGIDTWTTQFDTGLKLYNKRYNDNKFTSFTANYPERPTLSGEFITSDPLSYNSTFRK